MPLVGCVHRPNPGGEDAHYSSGKLPSGRRELSANEFYGESESCAFEIKLKANKKQKRIAIFFMISNLKCVLNYFEN